ncbi:hypothetical protein BGZ82_001890, partial [Podila clonocystis]
QVSTSTSASASASVSDSDPDAGPDANPEPEPAQQSHFLFEYCTAGIRSIFGPMALRDPSHLYTFSSPGSFFLFFFFLSWRAAHSSVASASYSPSACHNESNFIDSCSSDTDTDIDAF